MSEMRTQVLLSRHLYVVLSLPRRASSTAFIPAAQNLRAQRTLLRFNLPPPLPVLKQPALPTDRPTAGVVCRRRRCCSPPDRERRLGPGVADTDRHNVHQSRDLNFKLLYHKTGKHSTAGHSARAPSHHIVRTYTARPFDSPLHIFRYVGHTCLKRLLPQAYTAKMEPPIHTLWQVGVGVRGREIQH